MKTTSFTTNPLVVSVSVSMLALRYGRTRQRALRASPLPLVHFAPCLTPVRDRQVAVSGRWRRRSGADCRRKQSARARCLCCSVMVLHTSIVRRWRTHDGRRLNSPRPIRARSASLYWLVTMLRSFSMSSGRCWRRHCVRTFMRLFILSQALFVHEPRPASRLRRSIGMTCTTVLHSAYAAVVIFSVAICMSVYTECIVCKRCVLEQKLLLKVARIE